MPPFGDVSITSFMDPAFSYFATESGVPVQELSPIFGGELLGSGVELISDLILKGLSGKIVQGIIGVGTVAFATWGKDLNQRFRKELYEFGSHELTRVIDPKPHDIIEIRECIESIAQGIAANDADLILAGIFRTPEELKSMFEELPQYSSSGSVNEDDYGYDDPEEDLEDIEEDIDDDIDEDIGEADEYDSDEPEDIE